MRLAGLEKRMRIWTMGKRSTEQQKSNGDFFTYNGIARATSV
jgi:hypothetical protein